MLNEIEIKIINDLEEMSAESSQYENMKENYINLSKEEKQVYYNSKNELIYLCDNTTLKNKLGLTKLYNCIEF